MKKKVIMIAITLLLLYGVAFARHISNSILINFKWNNIFTVLKDSNGVAIKDSTGKTIHVTQ